VRQRQQHQHDIVRFDDSDGRSCHLFNARDQRAVGEHRAFRVAGCPRGVDHHREGLSTLGVNDGGIITADEGLKEALTSSCSSEHAGNTWRGRFGHICGGAIHNDQRQADMLDQWADLRCGERRVDGDDDSASPERTEVGDDQLGPVAQKQADPVAGPDTSRTKASGARIRLPVDV
jgi:hypothetical protein